VGRYVHLNPVRVLRLGLDKRRRAMDRLGLAPAPSREAVQERLGVLRTWRWSSYPAYAGWVAVPSWLSAEVLGRSCGGRTAAEERAALRAYTESAAREGLPERPWERLIGGVILGSESFARAVRAKLQPDEREQPGARQLRGRVSWEQIVRAVESAKGESWARFRDRHGDWGRDVALWVGRRLGRLKLRELAHLAGGLDYTTAGAAVNRIGRRLARCAVAATGPTNRASNCRISRCDPMPSHCPAPRCDPMPNRASNCRISRCDPMPTMPFRDVTPCPLLTPCTLPPCPPRGTVPVNDGRTEGRRKLFHSGQLNH
jgi:hypothetical protein